MTSAPAKFVIAVAAAMALAGPASAQLGGLSLPAAPGLPAIDLPGLDLPGPDLGRTLRRITDPRALDRLRLDRVRDLVRANPRDLALDPKGAPIVKGEVLAVGLSEAGLERARATGFTVLRSERLEGLDLSLATLAPPMGLSPVEALRRLRRIEPSATYDYNHIYFGAGGALLPVAATQAASGAPASGVTVGMIDTGVDQRHPALTATHVEQQGFAPGGLQPAAHGTAVGSLIAGRVRGFQGSAPGAALRVADVYGSTPRGGSAEAIARAFAWQVGSGVKVINVSLVGPPNAILQAAVQASLAKGALIVAAVGNDGPAAPPAYPASYPGVIAVTGVDRRERPLVEAGRALHVDFAAPGADLLAADARGGISTVRGTSFAAPLVAGALARLGGGAAAVRALAAGARDLGPKGPDKTFGRGLVGRDAPLASR